MKLHGAASSGIARLGAVFSVVAWMMMLGVTSTGLGQSKSGFTYNGINYASYQANEYLNSGPAAADMAATGANYAAVVVTQYVQTGTSTTIAPETTSTPSYNGNGPLTPTDAAVVSAIQSLQAQGITVILKPHLDSIDGTWRGYFTWPDSDTTTAEQQAWLTAWFSSYETYMLHYAQIASANNIGVLVIGTEFVELSGTNCAGESCRSYWDQYVINPIRASYPNLKLVYGANANSAGDEFTTVSFWDDLDIIGVEGYFNLTGQADPTVSQLVSAWTDSPKNDGFNAVAALSNLASSYNKPLIFTEIGYESTPGTNEEPWDFSLSDGYDPTEQADCYEAFFEVFSAQTSWMKGVFWWEWTVSAPGADDPGYSPQSKPAGTTVLPEWYTELTPSFTLTPSSGSVTLGQGLSSTDTITVNASGGFSSAVTLTASGLPSGVSASFASNPTTGSSVLTLTASSGAPVEGPISVTVTGTSGALTASTTIAVTVTTPVTQSITFTNPGNQVAGTQLGLTATASSGLPVAYDSSTTSSVCRVSSSTATALFVAPGTCTITASQAGYGAYLPAASVTRSFTVTTLAAVAVPANADVIVSQVNWLAALKGSAFGSINPDGNSLAVNSYGEIAVADTNNVVLFNAQTGAAITLGAWPNANAVAIDSQDNLYIGNSYEPVDTIVKLPYVGGTTNGGYAPFTTPTADLAVCTVSSSTECSLPANLGTSVNPGAMAFDTKGDLFWVSSGNGALAGNGLWECTVACLGGTGHPVQLYEEPTASPAPSVSSGQLLMGGLAIDSAGNVFFTDSSIYVDTSTSDITSFYSDLNELPVSTGAGYGGVTTGYAASPTVLYTLTPSPVGAYDYELDSVAIHRNTTTGDTVYFADQNDGILAFPDSSGGIPVASGRPTALYTVSNQGAKALTFDSRGNLYAEAYSTLIAPAGADTLAQITVGNVTVPPSQAGNAVSPSATLNPVTVILNDTTCAATPSPSVTFAAGTATNATATIDTGDTCSAAFSGAASFAAGVSFTPTATGTDSVALTGTDQSTNTGAVTVTGIGTGFTLLPSAPTLSVAQSSSNTETITITDIGGFNGGVTLAASGLPGGVTASFATNPATSSTVMTLTASSMAGLGGPATVTISGISGAITASTTIALTVTPPESFTLSPLASSLSVTQGSAASTTIRVMQVNGFSGGVALAAAGLPGGVTASFATNPTTSTSLMTLTASGTATVGGPVSVTINGTSGALNASTTITVTVNVGPSFTLSPLASSVSVTQGKTVTDTFTVTPANGFAGGVTYSASGLPSGVTASFSPNPSTTGSGVMTLTANSSATTGPATITITGTSGTLTASTTVSLTVNSIVNFALSPSPTGIEIAQGSIGTSTISVIGTNGFSSAVTFSASGLPSGVTASFAPNPGNGYSVMTLAASSTAVVGGPVIVTVTGTSGAQSTSTTIAVTVSGPSSFTISLSPAALSVAQGDSAGTIISVTGAGGFGGAVTFAASGLPSGVTASFAPNPAAGSSELMLTASSTAALAGPVTVTITGTSGNLEASTTVTVSVSPPASFALSASPSTLTVAQRTSGASTISMTGTGGFGGAVVLSATGLPGGVTASFTASTGTSSSVLTLTASGTATVGGPVTVTITGTSGTLTATTTIAVSVTAAPTFSLSGSSVTIEHGATTGNTATITVTPANGFTGTINLSCSVTPMLAVDPATCSLSPTSLTINGTAAQISTLTVTTSAGTSAESQKNGLFWPSAGGTALSLLLFFVVPRRRRTWAAVLGLLVVCVSMGVTGCTSGNGSGNGSSGTSTGSYVITVTATSGTITETGQVSLTVQ
jgi:hypothetical protein